jgi:hypothetical protein
MGYREQGRFVVEKIGLSALVIGNAAILASLYLQNSALLFPSLFVAIVGGVMLLIAQGRASVVKKSSSPNGLETQDGRSSELLSDGEKLVTLREVYTRFMLVFGVPVVIFLIAGKVYFFISLLIWIWSPFFIISPLTRRNWTGAAEKYRSITNRFAEIYVALIIGLLVVDFVLRRV